MRSQNHPIILFIDRNGFSVFQDALSNFPRFNFTPDIVANLDVVNREQFVSLIATFIQINKIIPSSLTVILSDTVIYTKALVNATQSTVQNPASQNPSSIPSNVNDEHKEEIQNFLEDIPFEEVLAKVVKINQVSSIVAVNKDLVMTIADVFINKGSAVEAIVPSFMYGPNVSFATGLTQNNIRVIQEESGVLKTGNLLTDQQTIISPQSLEIERIEKEKKPQNLSLYLLVGVFVTLLVILTVVYFNLGASKTPPVSSKITPTVPPTSGPTVVQTQASAIPIDLKSVIIKIIQNSESGEVAASIKNKLLEIGFQDIVNEVSQAKLSERSSVIFSKTVPADVRERAFVEIKKILPDISILESQDPNLTITILIGKS